LWQILLQKSKIEEARKSRENRFLDAPAVARLSGVNTKVGGRFGMKRCGPPHVATRETHQRSLKFWYFTRKRLLQQYRHFSDMPRQPDNVRSRGQSRNPAAGRRLPFFDPGCVKTQKSKRDEE
jgi:hypothetical protein